ncbi:MAG: carbohydrate kinase family protein [Bacillota bacterium]
MGNYNIDLVMAHLPEMPAWGTESIVQHMDPRTAGAAGYTSMTLARLGAQPLCLGNVGDDAYGRQIREDLQAHGANVQGLLAMPGVQTSVDVALVRSDGQRAFVSYTGHLDLLTEQAVLAAEASSTRMTGARYVLLTGYFLLPALGCQATSSLFRHWREKGLKVCLDTGWDPAGWPQATREEILSLLPWVDIFLPNEDEGRALTGETDPVAVAQSLAGHGPSAVVLKLGGNGSLAWTGGAVHRAKGFTVEVFDTTGAGDSFNAGLLYGLLHGWAWPRALRFANAVGAIVVSRRADRHPDVASVEHLIQQQGA